VNVGSIFLQNEDESEVEDEAQHVAASSFLAATCLSDTSIFEYFLGIWNEPFSSVGGKNSDGGCPIHVVCCDAHVSLQAIKVLVNHHPDALASGGWRTRTFFHFISLPCGMPSVWMSFFFYLLQQCPDALGVNVGGVPS
jgi:hypothetical protein